MAAVQADRTLVALQQATDFKPLNDVMEVGPTPACSRLVPLLDALCRTSAANLQGANAESFNAEVRKRFPQLHCCSISHSAARMDCCNAVQQEGRKIGRETAHPLNSAFVPCMHRSQHIWAGFRVDCLAQVAFYANSQIHTVAHGSMAATSRATLSVLMSYAQLPCTPCNA